MAMLYDGITRFSNGKNLIKTELLTASSQQPKIMLYSHDSWGIGHLRRTLAIAHALNRNIANASVLIASGSPYATHFPLETGVDLIKLPSVTKDANGQYAARQLRHGYQAVLDLRRAILLSVFESFRPDLLIVDHQIVGLSGELIPVLRRANDTGAYCIYGMRDVVDAAKVTEASWTTPSCQWAFTNAFQEVWIYGDQRYFDTVSHYPSLQAIKDHITYTGLIANGESVPVASKFVKHHVLVTAGGGEDGAALLKTYLRGLQTAPPDCHSTIITGPLLKESEARTIEAMTRTLPSVTLQRFHQSIPSLLRASDVVVCMAGYNSCAEFIDARCPAILVPRTFPRVEQLIRARYLEDYGIAKCLVAPSPLDLMNAVRSSLQLNAGTAPSFPATTGLDIIVRRARAILKAQCRQTLPAKSLSLR